MNDHFRVATQSMVLDAPRIIRKDITTLTEWVAKYQGLEGAFNSSGQEAMAEQISRLLEPLVEARAALEAVMEQGFTPEVLAPAMPNMSAEQSQTAAQVAFDLEDAIMEHIGNTTEVPTRVVVRADLHALLELAWPGRNELKMADGSVCKIEVAGQAQEAAFVFPAA